MIATVQTWFKGDVIFYYWSWKIWSQLESLNFQTPVHCGPVDLVSNFWEFIGVKLDHTPKRESVPDNLLYKGANHKKSWAQEVFVLRV
jgi:hypothetical protein